MPIYEYVCKACGTRSEVMQKVSDPAPGTCPSCGAPGPLERVVSRTSFQLKGGGWYSDLYSSTKKGGESSGKKSGGDAPKSESKPAESKPSGGDKGGSGS
jgi:putative FmdB family regulatory protein